MERRGCGERGLRETGESERVRDFGVREALMGGRLLSSGSCGALSLTREESRAAVVVGLAGCFFLLPNPKKLAVASMVLVEEERRGEGAGIVFVYDASDVVRMRGRLVRWNAIAWNVGRMWWNCGNIGQYMRKPMARGLRGTRYDEGLWYL